MTPILKKTVFIPLFFLLGLNTSFAQDCTVNADIPKTICDNSPMQLQGNSHGLFTLSATWSQIGGPSVNIVNPADLNSNVSGYVGGEIYTFRISATCKDGVRVYDDVVITVDPVTLANAGTDQESCPGTLTLDANTVGANEDGLWTVPSNDGDISVLSPASPVSQISLSTTNGGISQLRWTITNTNGCSSFDDVYITNYGGTTPVSAGSDQNLDFCYTVSQATSLSGSYGGNGNGGQQGTWSMVSGPNYATISDANNNETNISNLIEGTYVFRWDVSGPCVNGSDEITITVPGATQNVSNASTSDLRFCYGATTAVLEGSEPQFANEAGSWTQTGGPTATITSPTSATTSVTGLDGSSEYRFTYTITNSQTTCTDDDLAHIYFSTAPTIDAGTDLILNCGENSTDVSVLSTGGASSRYKILSGPITGDWISFSGTPTIDNLTDEGIYTILFERFSTGSGCTSAFDQMSISVSESPTASNAGTDQKLACNVIATDLAGNVPISGTGVWSQLEGPNTANIVDIYDESSHIDGLIEGSYKFRWLISGGNNCPVEQDDVLVIVSRTTASSAAGDARTVCHSTEVILSGNTPHDNETGIWTVSPSTGIGFANANDPSTAVSGMQANTPYTFTWTVENGCGPVSSDVVITTNNIAGPSFADAGNDQCEATTPITIDMAGNDPAVGLGKWTILSGPNTPTITDENLYNTQISNMIEGHYQIEWSINVSGCTSTRDTLVASILTSTTDSNADTDKSVCGSSVVMTANAPNAFETGHWEQISGNAGYTISNISANDATFSNLSPGRYEFSWIIEKGICPVSSDNLIITVSEAPDVSVTTADYAICSGTSATLAANNPTVGTGVWTLSGAATNAPTIASINSPTTTVTGLATGEYKFRWTITAGTDCSSEINDLTIQVSAPAVAEPSRDLCNTTETFLEGTEGTDGTWTIISGTPTPTIANTDANTAPVTNMGLGQTYVFQYEVPAIYGCPSTSDNLTINTSGYGTEPNAGPDQEICTSSGNSITMAANDPGTGVGGWTQVSGPNTSTIIDAGLFDTDVNDLIEGLYVYEWNVDYNYCGNFMDVIRINVYDPPTTADAGVDQTNACQLDAQLAGNIPTHGIGTWTVLSAPSSNAQSTVIIDNLNIGTSTISNISEIGTYVFRWTITSGICNESTDDVALTFTALPPTSPDAGADQELCNLNSITMAGNNPAIGTGTWSQISGPTGATIQNPNNFDTDITGTPTGELEFQWEIVSGGCTLTDNVTIVNSANPTVAATIADHDLCQFDAPVLSANEPIVGTGVWTQEVGPTSSVIQNPNSSLTNVTNTTFGAYTFRWTISNGNCPVSSNDLNITINPAPSLADAGADGEVCEQSYILAANNPVYGTGSWSTSGSGNFVSINSNSTQVNNLDYGVNELTWTISSPGCTSYSDDAYITSYETPSLSNAGSNDQICGSTYALSGNNPAVGTGVWSTTDGGVFANANSNSTSVSNLREGLNTLLWTISNGVCPSSASSIDIISDLNPTTADASSDQQICNTDLTLDGNNPTRGTGQWTVSPSGPDITNTAQYNSTVTNLTYEQLYSFTWTISNGVCPSSSDNVTATNNEDVTSSTINANQEICATTSTIEGNTPTVGTGVWSTTDGGSIDQPNSPSTFVTNLDLYTQNESAATYNNQFRWRVTNGSCIRDAYVDIIAWAAPVFTSAGIDDEIACQLTSALNADAPNPGEGQWTLSASPNVNTATINIVDDFDRQTDIRIPSDLGDYIFSWTITNGSVCTPTSDDVMVRFTDDPPTVPDAGTDQDLCEATIFQMEGNNVSVGTGTWSRISGPSGENITDINSPSTTVTTITYGTYVFRWTIVSGHCTLRDDVTIINSETPTTAVAGTNQEVCETNATMAANNPLVGIGTWTTPDGGNFADANSNSTTVSNLPYGLNTMTWTISNGACAPSQDDMTITSYQTPSDADAGADQDVCLFDATLNGNNPAVGTGLWTTTGNASFSNATIYNTPVSNLDVGLNSFTWTISNGVCSPSQNIVDITTFENPTAANAGIDQEVCETDATMAANSPAIGTGTWSTADGGIFADANSNSTTVSNLTYGINTMTWTISNGACAPTQDNMIITSFESPTPAEAGGNQNICLFDATLAGNDPTTGTGVGTGLWTTTGNATFTNTSVYNTAVSNLDVDINIFTWTISNGVCTDSDDMMNITAYDNPTIANAGTNQEVCETDAVMAANDPSIGTGTWSTANGGMFADANSNSTAVSNLAYGTNTLTWTISNGVCTDSQDDVQIISYESPTVANAGMDQEVCLFDATLAGNDPTVGNGIWTTTGGATFLNESIFNTTVSNLDVGPNNFTWTISNGVCADTQDIVDIVSFENPSDALAGNNQNVCETDASLMANNPLIGTGLWSVIQGTGSFADANSNSTAVSNMSYTTNIYRWTISNGPCIDKTSDVEIVSYQNPDIADAGTDQEVCMVGTNLDANNPSVGSGIWSTTGNAQFADLSLYNTAVSNLDVGINSFTWSIANTLNCPESSDEVDVINYDFPTVSDAGTDQEVCGNSAILSSNNPLIGTGTWTTTGSGIFTAATLFNSEVNQLDYSANTLSWTISNGVCAPSVSQVIVTAKENPDDLLLISGNTVCFGNDGNINIELSETNVNYEVFSGTNSIGTISGTGNNEDFIVLSNNLNIGANIFSLVATHSVSNCTVNMQNQPTVTVLDVPRSDINVSGNTVCDEFDGILTISSSENNIDYEAFIGNTSVGTATGDGSDLNIVIAYNDLFIGDNLIQVIASSPANCIDTLSENATILVNANPVSDLAITGGEFCNGDTAMVSIIESEENIQYELFNDQTVITSGIGTGNDIELFIPYGSYDTGNNYYNIKAVNQSTTCESDMDHQAEVLIEQCEIVVYDGFSPNGDGINETFIIEGLINYPNHKVTIFNRWGNKVYEASPYLSDWDGTNTMGLTVGGDKLPVGSYFYIIDPGDGSEVLKGYIYLNR